MPVGVGMMAIGAFTLLLFIAYLFIELLDFGNTHFKWWYVFIYIILYTPLAVCAFLFFNYFMGTDQDAARKKLPFAIWLAILALVLTSIWRMIYILAIYDEDEVYEGGKPWAEDDYTKKSKKSYIVWDVIFTTVLLFLYGYFLYFVISNNSLYDKWYEENPPSEEGDDEEKKPMMEEEAMEGE
jgi:flagellar basal body-associated protein FliL